MRSPVLEARFNIKSVEQSVFRDWLEALQATLVEAETPVRLKVEVETPVRFKAEAKTGMTVPLALPMEHPWINQSVEEFWDTPR